MSANKESVGKTLLVAFLVCVVCGVVVATAAVSLRPVQSKNQLLDKRMNILQAAGLYQPGVDVNKVFKSIERRFVDIDTQEPLATLETSGNNIDLIRSPAIHLSKKTRIQSRVVTDIGNTTTIWHTALVVKQ